MRRWIAVLALGAVVVACSEQATSPQAKTSSFKVGNHPTTGGPVERYSGNYWLSEFSSDGALVFYWFDAPAEHRSCHPPYTEQVGVGARIEEMFALGGGAWGDEDTRQKYVAQGSGVPVYVYDWAALRAARGPSPYNMDAWCAFMGTQWLYRGSVNMRYVDNDYIGWDLTPGLNVFHELINGSVHDPAGQAYHFQLRFYYQFDPAGDPPVRQMQDHLSFTPVGLP